MKVVQTSKAYYPMIGGIETTITNLSEGLVKKGIDVSVLVCNHHNTLKEEQRIINGVNVTYAPKFLTLYSLPISPTYPHIFHQFSGDILHVHEPFPLADLSLEMFSELKRKFSSIVVTWHSDIIRQKFFLPLYRPILVKFLKEVDLIMVSNPNLVLNSELLSMYQDKCAVVPIGIEYPILDSAKIHSMANEIRNTYSPFVLFVGRLVYYKGLEYLIDAMRDISDASLVIIGDGPLKRKLMSQVERFSMTSKVFFLPHFSRRELFAYYEACELFVLPSIERSEAYGIVQLEAMACGKPVVCTDLKTGTAFINRHNETGLVVPPRDSKALAEAISLLLSNHELRNRFGENARRRFNQEFTLENMVTNTITYYEKLLGRS